MAEEPFRFKSSYSLNEHKISDSESDNSENEGKFFYVPLLHGSV